MAEITIPQPNDDARQSMHALATTMRRYLDDQRKLNDKQLDMARAADDGDYEKVLSLNREANAIAIVGDKMRGQIIAIMQTIENQQPDLIHAIVKKYDRADLLKKCETRSVEDLRHDLTNHESRCDVMVCDIGAWMREAIDIAESSTQNAH